MAAMLCAILGADLMIGTRNVSAQIATTTTALNLRAQMSTSAPVKLVMPAGATVEVIRRLSNGFYRIVYQGVGGYAHGDYLNIGGTSGGGSNNGGSSGGATGSARTTSSLNLRAGPSTSDRVLLVMPSGASVTLTGETSNGFSKLTYQGTTGWASSQYLSTSGGGSNNGGSTPTNPGSGPSGNATTTSSLNLRAGPSTNDRVLLVMPLGARVTLTGETSNGFSKLTYQSTTGWASTQYLSTSGGGSINGGGSGSDPGSGNAGTAYTTSSVNLRAGPSTSDRVLLVVPSGAQVTLTGSTQNGFSGVSYNGTRGWMSSQYLSADGGGSNNGGGASSSITWPVRGGTWTVIQGYNGGTHNGSTYRYSLDIAKGSGTAGADVYSPVSGTVVWNDPNSGGLAIDIGGGYTMCMFHVTFSGDLGRGDTITQGQWLGTISGPGGPGYASTPHVDMTLWASGRVSTPFSGAFAISGQSFAGGASYNLHGGTTIRP